MQARSDVGSLPIGLLLGWLLLVLAGNGGRAAATLLPLYYLADSTITLIRRAANREPVWQAHRSHFYQRATDRGFTVLEIVARVFGVNLALAALAVTTIVLPSRMTDIAAVSAGAALVTSLLVVFARPKTGVIFACENPQTSLVTHFRSFRGGLQMWARWATETRGIIDEWLAVCGA